MEATVTPPEPEPTTTVTDSDAEPPVLGVRLALAAMCAAAGAVHLVMVPGHSQESTLDGLLFLLAGWAQVALAVALLAWPRRVVLQATVAVNALAAAAWAASRTVGLPFGANPGESEAATTIDQMTTAFEVAAVIVAAAALARPGLWRSAGARTVPAGAIAAAGVIVAASVVLTSPEAANHHSSGDASVAPAQLVSAGDRCDLAFNPAAYWQEATTAGWDTVTGGRTAGTQSTGGGAAASGAGHHGGGAAAAPTAPAGTTDTTIAPVNGGRGSADLDRLTSLSSGAGEAEDAALVSELAEVPDDIYDAWVRRLSTYGTHAGPQTWTAVTDPQTCDTLGAELEQARAVAARYPTPADARAAGYTQVTTYVPGIASHWMNFSLVDESFAIDEPEMLLYDGSADNASIVGLSYYLILDGDTEPSQGFSGDNDHYHRHDGLCVSGTLVIGDTTTSPEDCAARGGAKLDGTNRWMSHAWVVPGCESPWGVFSGVNPLLDPRLGEQSGGDGGGCAGSGVRDRYDLSPGDAANSPTTVTGADPQVAAP